MKAFNQPLDPFESEKLIRRAIGVTPSQHEDICKLEANATFERSFKKVEEKKTSLVIVNALGLAVHVCLAIAVAVSNAMHIPDGKTWLGTPQLSLFYTELRWVGTDATSWKDSKICNPDPRMQYLVPIYQMVPEDEDFLSLSALAFGFFALSGLFHLFYLADMCRKEVRKSVYLTTMARKQQPFRFLEYSFSASVMILAIAYISGRRGVTELAYSFVLMFVTMAFGWMAELVAYFLDELNPYKWNPKHFLLALAPFLIGFVPYATVWTVLVKSFVDNTSRFAEEYDRYPPAYAYIAVYAQVVIFSCFSIPQILQISARRQDKFEMVKENSVEDKDTINNAILQDTINNAILQRHERITSTFVRCELAYVALSAVAKGLLGGALLAQVFVLTTGNLDESLTGSNSA